MADTLLVAKKSGMIYELLEVDGDRIHLKNLTNGKEGWLEGEELSKLVVNIPLTSMQERNPILKELINTLNLCHERN